MFVVLLERSVPQGEDEAWREGEVQEGSTFFLFWKREAGRREGGREGGKEDSLPCASGSMPAVSVPTTGKTPAPSEEWMA